MRRSIVAPALAHSLDDWGWDETWRVAFEPHAGRGLVPARVVAQHRGQWLLAGERGERSATLTGRYRFTSGDAEDMPAVGDWVAAQETTAGETQIDALLPRRSAFRRRAAGPRVGAQVLAANVDTLLVAASLNRDLNLRRLERYLAMATESGAEAVVALTKTDLVDDPGSAAERVTTDLRVDVLGISAVTGDGIAALRSRLAPGRTVAVVGSSGVGKSTLLNVLAGEELMATREVREDDARGRHTTTHRELFQLPGGALLLDTPGMRELGLWDADEGVEATFPEITELALRCRFGDCRHEREPGCAVQVAIASGELDARRLRSYRRLAKEVAEQPSPAARREASRKFFRMVRRAGEESMARKTYRFREE